jgi:hypothetical protein
MEFGSMRIKRDAFGFRRGNVDRVRWIGRCLLPTLIGLAGCAGDQVRSGTMPTTLPSVGSTPSTILPPVAYWRIPGATGRGEAIRPEQLEETMIELAGRLALQEIVLDRLLARELASGRIRIADGAIEEEASILLRALDPDPDQAVRLLDEVRRREGLGPVRYANLLRRNAILRALVAPDVKITEETIRAAWDLEHGPRRVARILVADDLPAIVEVRRRLDDGIPFAELAARTSTDPSASTGGLIDPVARLDPSWPASFRSALWSMEPGEISGPILVGDAYILIKFVEERDGDGVSLETGRVAATRIARRAQERLLMDAAARRMIDGIQVDIIEASLEQAYRSSP